MAQISLAAEAVEGASLALESVDDVHGSDSLAAGVLGVRDRIADDVLEEHLEDTAGLLVDESRDALDTTPACQTADRGLGDALDVVPQDLAVALGASLSESLSSFAASRHFVVCLCVVVRVCSKEFACLLLIKKEKEKNTEERKQSGKIK